MKGKKPNAFILATFGAQSTTVARTLHVGDSTVAQWARLGRVPYTAMVAWRALIESRDPLLVKLPQVYPSVIGA